jgi:hypothetical protein
MQSICSTDVFWQHRRHERQPFFQCHGGSTNKQQFLKAAGVLDEHINKPFASICRTFEVVKLMQPPDITKEEYDGDMGKQMIWQTYMKLYMKRTDMLMESNMGASTPSFGGNTGP